MYKSAWEIGCIFRQTACYFAVGKICAYVLKMCDLYLHLKVWKWFAKHVCDFFPTLILCFMCDFRSVVLMQNGKMKNWWEVVLKNYSKQGKTNSFLRWNKYKSTIKSIKKRQIMPWLHHIMWSLDWNLVSFQCLVLCCWGPGSTPSHGPT